MKTATTRILRNATLAASLALSTTTAVDAQALVNGGSIDSSLTVAGQVNTHSFFANGGEGFQVQLRDLALSAFDPRLEVTDPLGNSFGVDISAAVARVAGVAPLTGTYTVSVSDGNSTPTETGPYRVYLVRAPGANEGGVLPNGGVVAGTIDSGDLDSYTFSITSGESYQLRFADTAATILDPRITVYDPMGELVATDLSANVASLSAVAPRSGTYTVVLGDSNSEPSAVGDYNLYFAKIPGVNAGGALSSGTQVTDAIDLGEIDSYTFSILAGEYFLLHLADLSGSPFDPVLWLYDPQGCFIASDLDADVAQIEAVATFSGDYTILVTDGNADPSATGAYRLNYQRSPGAVSEGALALGSSVVGRVDLGDLDSYTFSAQAGEAVVMQVADTEGTAFDPLLQVFDPRGILLATDLGANVANLSFVAQLSGTYTVVVSDGNASPSATGDYELFYERLPGAVGKAVFSGSVATGEIVLGDLDTFTFSLGIGDSYTFQIVDTLGTTFDPLGRLFDPRGVQINQDLDARVAALSGTVARAGEYTLLIGDGNSEPSATGSYEVHYVRTPSANEHGFLLEGEVASETIDLGDLDSYTFRADEGQVVQISLTDTNLTTFDPALELYDPFGRFLAADVDAVSAQIERLLTRSGTYTIIASDGNSSPVGVGDYTILVNGTGLAGNAGCSNEGPPTLGVRPSAATGFVISAPPSSRACATPQVVVVGSPTPGPILLGAPLTCGPCGLSIGTILRSSASPLEVLPLPPSALGVTVTAQWVCGTASCLNLSAPLTFTIEP